MPYKNIEGKDIVPPKVSITNNMCAFHKAIRIILCVSYICNVKTTNHERCTVPCD